MIQEKTAVKCTARYDANNNNTTHSLLLSLAVVKLYFGECTTSASTAFLNPPNTTIIIYICGLYNIYVMKKKGILSEKSIFFCSIIKRNWFSAVSGGAEKIWEGYMYVRFWKTIMTMIVS